jgi:hypothetical protein
VAAVVAALLSALALAATMGMNAYGGMLTVLTAIDSVKPITPSRRARVVGILVLTVVWFGIGELISADAVTTVFTALTLMLYLGGDPRRRPHHRPAAVAGAARAGREPIALVHLDAHLDTWDTYFNAAYTHGTPFRRAAEAGSPGRRRVRARGHARPALLPG